MQAIGRRGSLPIQIPVQNFTLQPSPSLHLRPALSTSEPYRIPFQVLEAVQGESALVSKLAPDIFSSSSQPDLSFRTSNWPLQAWPSSYG